jgi:hypothetical protein
MTTDIVTVDLVDMTFAYGRTLHADGSITPWCVSHSIVPAHNVRIEYVDGKWTHISIQQDAPNGFIKHSFDPNAYMETLGAIFIECARTNREKLV